MNRLNTYYHPDRLLSWQNENGYWKEEPIKLNSLCFG